MSTHPKGGSAKIAVVAVIAILALGGLAAWRVMIGPAPIVPPNLESLDPEIAGLIDEASSKVSLMGGLTGPRLHLANIYEANQMYGYASATYAQLIETGAGTADTWYRYACMISWDGKIDEAVRAVDRSIELDGSRSYTYWRRAMWLLDLGKLDEAEASIEQSEAIDPDDPATKYARVRLLLARRQGAEALAMIEKYELDSPTGGASHNHSVGGYGLSLRADALRQVGRTDEARGALTRAGNADPTFRDPSYTSVLRLRAGVMSEFARAQDLMNAGSYTSAAALLRTLIPKLPEDEYRVHNLLGICELRMGNSEEGIAMLNVALERSNNYETLSNIARAMLAHIHDKGILESTALSHAQEAVNRRPGFGAGHEVLGRVYARLGDHERAYEEFLESYELDSRTSLGLELAGFALIELGRFDEARQVFDRALSVDPNSGDAWVGVASTHAKAGEAVEADNALREAAKRTVLNEARFRIVGKQVDSLLRERRRGQ